MENTTLLIPDIIVTPSCHAKRRARNARVAVDRALVNDGMARLRLSLKVWARDSASAKKQYTEIEIGRVICRTTDAVEYVRSEVRRLLAQLDKLKIELVV